MLEIIAAQEMSLKIIPPIPQSLHTSLSAEAIPGIIINKKLIIAIVFLIILLSPFLDIINIYIAVPRNTIRVRND